MALYIVTGAPASGKSTYIREHAQPGDIRIDYDEIANTLSGMDPNNHTHPQHVKNITKATRTAAIKAAMRYANQVDVWIIHSTPTQSTLDDYREHGAEIITIDPGKDTVMQRIKNERPEHMLKIAATWYGDKPKQVQAHKRGYDDRHRANKKRLLARHKDGTACQWCGKPMWKNPENNFDKAPLEADHSKPIKHHGQHQLADRLLHRACNRQRKDNPALTRPEGMRKLDEETHHNTEGTTAPVVDWG